MKSQLGQFYTTNYKHILTGLYIPEKTTTVIEPFCGNGDLLSLVPLGVDLELYDIEPKYNGTVRRNTLLHPPSYANKFVLTNPPYLARNKAKDKILFDKCKVNDLYKCFIQNLIDDCADGGILIIPLNFWSSIRKSDITMRRKFLSMYSVLSLNIFEYPVFDDTSYAVCSFQFERSDSGNNDLSIAVYRTPDEVSSIHCNVDNSMCLIGGEVYDIPYSKEYKITRLTSSTKEEATNIVVHCIDGKASKIRMVMVEEGKDRYIDDTPKLSARSFATLVITPLLSMRTQRRLVDLFNTFMTTKRSENNSLFLTNYREGSRKRISFALVYRIVSYLLSTIQ